MNIEYNSIINYFLEILKITIPAVASVGIFVYGRLFEKQKEADAKIREKKVEFYEKFFMTQHKFLMESPNANKKQADKLREELANAFAEFTKNLMFWGSSDVIRAYNHLLFRMRAKDHKMEDFEDFYMSLRKDIGHNNKNLVKYDLLKLMLKSDEFDQNGKPLKSTLINNREEE